MSLPAMAYDDPKVEPMHQNSRALRRASDVASARAAVTSRRPVSIASAALGTLLGLTLTVGVVSGPAAGAEPVDPIAAVTAMVSGGELPARYVDHAAGTLAEAKEALADAEALSADVAESTLDLGKTPAAIDTAALEGNVQALEGRGDLPDVAIPLLTADTDAEIAAVVAEKSALAKAFTAAKEKKAAEEAARAAAEKAAKEEAARVASAIASGNTVAGAKATAQRIALDDYGWGADQFSCLESLWTKESGWNYQAYNPSGATGIPQALPGSKMASAGSDWESNATTQIIWGLGYISSVYGAPCGAWSHSQSVNWY